MIQRRNTLPPSRTGLSLKSKQRKAELIVQPKEEKIDEAHGSPQFFSEKRNHLFPMFTVDKKSSNGLPL